jgi:L-lactate dehydrogenase complex protein LldG
VGRAAEGIMSDRDIVLAKIRKSLKADAGDVGRRAITIARLEGAPRGVIPARGQLPPEERIALFVAMAEKVSATVDRVADRSAVPTAVAGFLRKHNLPATLRMGDDPQLADMPWSTTQIEVSRGPSDGSDPVGMSHASAGVAETGTLVLTSGPDNPTTINFLPETHVVMVDAADIAGDYETVWDELRERYGKGVLPRTVNLVTGPSRSADIEQKLLLGAHGPRRLHIVVVG